MISNTKLIMRLNELEFSVCFTVCRYSHTYYFIWSLWSLGRGVYTGNRVTLCHREIPNSFFSTLTSGQSVHFTHSPEQDVLVFHSSYSALHIYPEFLSHRRVMEYNWALSLFPFVPALLPSLLWGLCSHNSIIFSLQSIGTQRLREAMFSRRPHSQ